MCELISPHCQIDKLSYFKLNLQYFKMRKTQSFQEFDEEKEERQGQEEDSTTQMSIYEEEDEVENVSNTYVNRLKQFFMASIIILVFVSLILAVFYYHKAAENLKALRTYSKLSEQLIQQSRKNLTNKQKASQKVNYALNILYTLMDGQVSSKYDENQAIQELQGSKTPVEFPSQAQLKIKHQLNSLKLPLTLPITNERGIKIEDYIYRDDIIRLKRITYQEDRVAFVNNHSQQFKQLHLAKHNLILNAEGAKEADQDNSAEWMRLQQKYQLSAIKKQLPFCIISPGYNNEPNFRIEYSLNSIFTQNYTNYKLILINDGSDDGSDQIYRKYFEFLGLDKSQYLYIVNKKRFSAMQNYYTASTKFCDKESIVIPLDADDELIGRNTLKLFNWAYQTHKAGVVYSNFYWYIQSMKVMNGFTSILQYAQEEKEKLLYREKYKISQLRSFRNELFLEIDPKDFKDSNGKFYEMTSDFAMFMPLLELSCGRIYKFKDEYHYLYNSNTGINDGIRSREQQWKIQQQIKQKAKYTCSRQFEQKMKNE